MMGQASAPVVRDIASWNALLRQVCGRFDAELPEETPDFVGSLVHRSVGGLGLTALQTNAGRITCQRVSAASGSWQTDDRYCFLVLQRQGHSWLRQHDVTLKLVPGDMVLLDALQGCMIVPQGIIEHVSVHLDRARLVQMLPAREPRLGRIDVNSVSGRAMQAMLMQILGAEDAAREEASPDEGGALQAALMSLLGPALAEDGGLADHLFLQAEPDEPAMRDRIRGGLMSVARQCIDRMLDDPELTPARIAGHLGISVRQLYRLFEESGESVCRYLLRQRLTRAARMLRDARWQNASITDVAYACGFNEAAHFSRSFRRQFGQTPRDYRALDEVRAGCLC